MKTHKCTFYCLESQNTQADTVRTDTLITDGYLENAKTNLVVGYTFV